MKRKFSLIICIALVVTVTAQVMNSKICSLMLLDEDKNELVIRATQSVSETYNKNPNELITNLAKIA